MKAGHLRRQALGLDPLGVPRPFAGLVLGAARAAARTRPPTVARAAQVKLPNGTRQPPVVIRLLLLASALALDLPDFAPSIVRQMLLQRPFGSSRNRTLLVQEMRTTGRAALCQSLSSGRTGGCLTLRTQKGGKDGALQQVLPLVNGISNYNHCLPHSAG